MSHHWSRKLKLGEATSLIVNTHKLTLTFKVTAYNQLTNHRLRPGNMSAGNRVIAGAKNIQKHVQKLHPMHNKTSTS